jgi:hypothetical protein
VEVDTSSNQKFFHDVRTKFNTAVPNICFEGAFGAQSKSKKPPRAKQGSPSAIAKSDRYDYGGGYFAVFGANGTSKRTPHLNATRRSRRPSAKMVTSTLARKKDGNYLYVRIPIQGGMSEFSWGDAPYQWQTNDEVTRTKR